MSIDVFLTFDPDTFFPLTLTYSQGNKNKISFVLDHIFLPQQKTNYQEDQMFIYLIFVRLNIYKTSAYYEEIMNASQFLVNH